MTIDFFVKQNNSRITVIENVGIILFLNVNFKKLGQLIRDVTKNLKEFNYGSIIDQSSTLN